MIKALSITEGRLAPADPDVAQVLVYINPDESERQGLVGRYNIDEHNVISALDPDEVSRLEIEPDHVALIYKRPKNYSTEDEFFFRIASTGLFLRKDKLIIVVSEDISLFDGRQFARIASLADLTLKLLYRTIFHFIEHLRVINTVSASLEQQINTSMQNRYLLNLFTLEKSLVYYLNAINGNRKLIELLTRNAVKLDLNADQLEFLDDIRIENDQCYQQAEVYSNILASMMDARASIVSNNLNWLMKTLNIITIGIMVPTLVVSVFSMNVEIPLEHHPLAFWVIVGMATGGMLLVVLLWWWRKW
jgi:magnesium transporter